MLLDWITLTFSCTCVPCLCVAFLCRVNFKMELSVTLTTWSYFLQMQASWCKKVILGVSATWGHSVCFATCMGQNVWAEICKNSHNSKDDICWAQIFQQKTDCILQASSIFPPLYFLWFRPLCVISEHALRLDSSK